jgi:hypothetical protein
MPPFADLIYAWQKLLRAKYKKARMSFASMVGFDLRKFDIKCRFFSWSRYLSKANLTSVDKKGTSFKNAKPDNVKGYKA